MQNQKLCLKWNNHMSNMLSLLGSFQQKDMLVDVTISCEGQNIKAHKIILSACSPYFQNLFMENPCQHPVIFMHAMKFVDITAILNFMYKGEVNVSHDGLSSFLQAAEALKVKGLAEVCGEKKGTNSISQDIQQSELNRPQRTDTPPRKRPRNRKRSLSDSNRSDDEALSRKHREPSSPEIHELSGDESFTGDNSSNGPPFNSVSRVPQNVYSRSHQSSSNMVGDEEDEYEVESNKMHDTTDSNVSMNNTNTDNNLRIERIMGNATEIESSSLQDPESPPDIKPIINFGEGSAGPSESGTMMLYNEQSQPGPSNVQEGSILHDNSHPQVFQNSVIRLLETIMLEQKNLRSIVDQLAPTSKPLPDDCPQFPINTLEDMHTLNRYLANTGNFSKIIQFLGVIGGKDAADCTRKICSRIISNSLAQILNWNGSGVLQKKSIKEFSNVLILITVSVQHNNRFKETSEAAVHDVMKRWLRTASDRDGGRNTRLEKINSKVSELNSKVENLTEIVERNSTISTESTLIDVLPSDIKLPVEAVVELELLNDKLRGDKEFCGLMVRYLFNAGSGKSQCSFVLSLTKRMLGQQVAVQFSRFGRKGKQSFLKFNEALNVILAAASMKFPNADRETLAEMFGKALAGAPDWNGRRIRPSDCSFIVSDEPHL